MHLPHMDTVIEWTIIFITLANLAYRFSIDIDEVKFTGGKFFDSCTSVLIDLCPDSNYSIGFERILTRVDNLSL